MSYKAIRLALLIIYLVLAAQFESLRDPLVILVSVPMANKSPRGRERTIATSEECDSSEQ